MGLAAWAIVGVLWAFGLLAIMTIGLPVLFVAAITTVFVARHDTWRGGLVGLAAGGSLPLLYVAWLNRDGPGTVCSPIEGGERCTEEMSPWPWVGAAVLLTSFAVYRALTSRGARARLRLRPRSASTRSP